MRLCTHVLSALVIASFVSGLLPAALAHSERPAEFPDGTGSVPDYRVSGPKLVVCKSDSADRIADLEPLFLRLVNYALLDDCAFEHIQAAVDAVTAPGSRILVLPGEYREEPSLAPLSPECDALAGDRPLSYQQQIDCPHLDNLIAVFGDDPADAGNQCTTERLCRLQIEGTGDDPYDVVVDNAWNKLNALRADRADGFHLRNMVLQRSEFNAIYVMETDGFVLDDVVARWNWEYGILTFAVDHGLYSDCEAYGNGDAGLYPGSASDLHGVRPSVEITRCDSHHNALGYSGTAGNSVYVHDNDFHHNAAGITMDSLFPGHPGLPQDSAKFVGNRIYSNNENYYDNFLGEDAPCLRDDVSAMEIENGTVCPTAPVPVGTGLLIAGGNNNLVAENTFWDNHRYSIILFTVPAILRDEMDPLKQLDTSHFNRFLDNTMGLDAAGNADPDALETWWDDGGAGNCWQGNTASDGWTSDPPGVLLPDCDAMPVVQRPPNVAKLATIAPCALYSNPDNHHPVGCPWLETPPEPEEASAARWFDVPAVMPIAVPMPTAYVERTLASMQWDSTAWAAALSGLPTLGAVTSHAAAPLPGSDQGIHGPVWVR